MVKMWNADCGHPVTLNLETGVDLAPVTHVITRLRFFIKMTTQLHY